jgi:hypothetical protein
LIPVLIPVPHSPERAVQTRRQGLLYPVSWYLIRYTGCATCGPTAPPSQCKAPRDTGRGATPVTAYFLPLRYFSGSHLRYGPLLWLGPGLPFTVARQQYRIRQSWFKPSGSFVVRVSTNAHWTIARMERTAPIANRTLEATPSQLVKVQHYNH